MIRPSVNTVSAAGGSVARRPTSAGAAAQPGVVDLGAHASIYDATDGTDGTADPPSSSYSDAEVVPFGGGPGAASSNGEIRAATSVPSGAATSVPSGGLTKGGRLGAVPAGGGQGGAQGGAQGGSLGGALLVVLLILLTIASGVVVLWSMGRHTPWSAETHLMDDIKTLPSVVLPVLLPALEHARAEASAALQHARERLSVATSGRQHFGSQRLPADEEKVWSFSSGCIPTAWIVIGSFATADSRIVAAHDLTAPMPRSHIGHTPSVPHTSGYNSVILVYHTPVLYAWHHHSPRISACKGRRRRRRRGIWDGHRASRKLLAQGGVRIADGPGTAVNAPLQPYTLRL